MNELIENLEDENDIILKTHNLVDNAFIIARRNLRDIPFKPKMNKDDFHLTDKIA